MVTASKAGVCKYCGSPYHRGWQCRLRPKKTTKSVQPKPKKKRPKNERRKLIADFDKVYSQYIRLKAQEEKKLYCYVCGKKLTYDTAVVMHFINRRFISVRFDEDNAHIGCRSCNAVGKGQAEVLEKYAEKLGEETVARLSQTSKERISTQELKQVYEVYKNRLKLLKKHLL